MYYRFGYRESVEPKDVGLFGRKGEWFRGAASLLREMPYNLRDRIDATYLNYHSGKG